MPSDHAYSRLSILMPASALRAFGRLNVPIYRLTRGRLMNKVGRAPVMLLTSTGRRSGQPRTAPVLYLADGERLIVVSSNGGNDHAPAWSYNLKANPDADVEIRGDRRRVRARVADGEERADLWQKVNQQYAGFADYDETTSREIAVFVLEPR
ncbi:MAG TPA: nitroreductase family deazaflavin-dependent oxidoreductase [Solirubrobacteraceae bacterium]|jgi:deazaflavin-dependent oxidoreductase (nitroreductase family)|nr:nitroreductase family deazaflavin-dependent oxidoreductase [Solirubrobacteraceae bacterium]